MKIRNIEKKSFNKKQVLENIVEYIFVICKNDNNFNLKDKFKELESKSENIHNKIKKQMSLIEQADVLKSDIQNKINILDAEIFSIRSELLENLGSEL